MKRRKKKLFLLRYIIILLFLILILIIINKSETIYTIKDKFNLILGSVNINKTKIVYDKTLKEENEALKREIEKLNKTYILENESFERINAKIINRNYSSYFSTITLNKGKKDGVKVNSAVINEKGLVGKISKVLENSSVVNLISNKNNMLSSKFIYKDKEYYGIITKYDQKNNLLYLEKVIGTFDDSLKGEIVLTSGLNDGLKSDILIGNIISFKTDKYNLSNTVLIRPSIDLNDITFVSIVKEKKW